MSYIHRIENPVDEYNRLTDYIIAHFLTIFPDDNPDHYTVEDMIALITDKAKEGVSLMDWQIQYAQDSINQDFAFMNGVLKTLVNSGGE